MNIVFVIQAPLPSSYASGINTVMSAQGVAQMGYNTTLLAALKPWRLKTCLSVNWDYYGIVPQFRMQRVPELPRLAWPFINQVLCQLKKKTDVLLYTRNLELSLRAASQGIETLLEVHSAFTEAEVDKVVAFLKLSAGKGLVLITQALRKFMEGKIPEDLAIKKTIVMPDAVLTERFSVDAADFKQQRNKVQVGYVGSLYPGKGMEVILPLAKAMPEVKFLVYGGREPFLADWQSRARGIANLELRGAVNPGKVPECLREFEIALLPNQPEVLIPRGDDIGLYTSPLKLFEYFAAGKAVIASDLPVLKEVLTNKENCILVKHNDIGGWKSKIEKLLADFRLREKISQNGRQEAEGRFSLKARFGRIFSWLETK